MTPTPNCTPKTCEVRENVVDKRICRPRGCECTAVTLRAARHHPVNEARPPGKWHLRSQDSRSCESYSISCLRFESLQVVCGTMDQCRSSTDATTRRIYVERHTPQKEKYDTRPEDRHTHTKCVAYENFDSTPEIDEA